MRHLITTILMVAFASAIFAGIAGRCSENSSEGNVPDAVVEDTLIHDTMTRVIAAVKEILRPPMRYYGDTIYQYDDKTVVYDYSAENDYFVTSLSHSRIITYRDTVPVHVCRVNGNGWYYAQGETLKFSIGVDTVYYNFKRLPDSVSPELSLMPSGFHRYFHTHTFSLPESWDCCFKFRAYLPDSVPSWTKQLIAIIMRKDIQGMYGESKGGEKILREYYGIKSSPHKINNLDVSQMTPRQIAKFFSKEYERLYRKQYGVDCEMDPKYDYMFEMFPAWKSSDGRYITYRFYIYTNTMGLHGFMEEYYLTFDNDSGKILGFNDIFSEKEFGRVTGMFAKEITEYKVGLGYSGEFSAWIDKDALSSNVTDIIKEVRNDSMYYPRPALTRKGVVFSFQPYEIVGFAEGVRHFLVPYNRLKLKIKR